jgi:hypothetical protein
MLRRRQSNPDQCDYDRRHRLVYERSRATGVQRRRRSVRLVGRKVDADDLVGAAEIAARLGLSHRESVHTLRKRDASFPQPVARLRTALVWAWPDVEKWARQTGRLPEEDQDDGEH